MAHYEQRLDADRKAIRKLVRRIGETVIEALSHSTRAVLNNDLDLASETILGDLAINRMTRELDRKCHVFVARHLPSAGHLRFISSVLRLSIALERIGDYAETVSRTTPQLKEPPPAAVAKDIEMMADQSRRILVQALEAFDKRDTSLAAKTLGSAAQLALIFDEVFTRLVEVGEQRTRSVEDLFSILATFNRLERIMHQAKNICEETIFTVTGETKGEKTFDILFVDERNDGASQLAEHFARKAFPKSGVYQSAGWNPAEEVDPKYAGFGEGKGLDMADARPIQLQSILGRLADFKLLVALDPAVREHVSRLPFHTTLLVWDLTGASGPEAAYKELAPRLRDLMERLRGEEAD